MRERKSDNIVRKLESELLNITHCDRPLHIPTGSLPTNILCII